MIWSFGVNPRFLNLSWIFVIPLRMQGPVLFLVVWREYFWNHSSRPPIYNYYLCMISLEIVQLGQNKNFQLDQIAGGVLHLCSPLAWLIKVLYLPLLLPLVVVSAGPSAFLLWSLILGDTFKLAYMWVLAMLRKGFVLDFLEQGAFGWAAEDLMVKIC